MKQFLTNTVTIVLFVLMGSLARANNFVVSNGNNTGAGSLRQAILDANADPAAPHTITFTVSGVINITTSLPTITRQVTIDGGNTVTISGPGGNNVIALFVLGTGSNGSTIRNLTMRNTGLEPIRLAVASTGVTIENMILTHTGPHYMNRAILANAAVANLTIRNVTVTSLEDKLQGIYIGGNATNVMIDGYHLSAGGGLTARGIHVGGITNGFTVKNSTIDLDDPATADDGDYGIVFAGAASNVTIDSSTFRDNEIAAVYFGAGASNINIRNSKFDNLDGWIRNTFLLFRNNTNTVTIDKNTFESKYRTGADDGDYGILMYGVSNQAVNVLNNKFNDCDTSGIYVGKTNTTHNHDNFTIRGNTFTKNGYGGATGAIDFLARNTTSDGGAVLITENTFSDNNGVSVFIHPGNTTTYVVPNLTISKNIIYNTKSVYGAIRINYVDKINITQNSVYNNQGLGIELAGVANCGYEGTNTPTILTSTETTPGTYNLTVRMPAICGAGNCSIEIFSNEAGVKGVGGQHYVETRTGLSSGNNVLNGVTGSFSEITGAPYGTWTATLKINNNCGSSEYSAKKAIKPNGPAGISAGIGVWLRGDDLSVNNAEPTASGQVITGWQEFSGNGPSATTVINNPLTKLNGINFNPVADMDGDGIRGLFPPNAVSWITSNATTSVAVFNPLSITASNDRFYCLFSQAGSDFNTNYAQIEFWRTGNNIQSYRGNTALAPAIPGLTGVSAFNKPGVFSSVTSPTNHTYYYNGANMGTGNYNKGNFAISQWFVGTGWNTTDGWQGGSETDFAEVFTYNRVLTAGELQKVQSYMALKYGIAMKQNYVLSDSTTVWNVTTNAAHSKEIAALARDRVSVLDQKQARAFHADEVVTIGLGSIIAATNNDNADSIINNLSVFMWGNDSAATTLTTAFTAGTYSSTRMARVWKVQKTNWVDKDITIQLKSGKTNNYLLISTDPTFATITQELQLSSTGTVTLSSALLAHGNYFTFGRQQKSPGGVLNGLSVWTKADEGVTLSGSIATSWEDQAASQRVWASTAATIPWASSSINYNPVVQFSGANYFRYAQFTPSFTQGEVFSVQSSPVNNVASFPWQLGGSSGATGVVYRWTDNNIYLHYGVAARRNFSYGAKNMALPVILNVNSATGSWTASLDGRVMSGPTAVATSFVQASGLAYNYIGAGHNSVFNGPIPEVIGYNRKLTATERQQVNSYLAIRYGITIDQTIATDYLASDGTTRMWTAADNSGFVTNIAGIGRDEIGSLNQKQSRSINTAASGNLVAIATGNEVAVSNADNIDTITNNKSFLVWGDNNAAVTYTTVIAGENVTVRMPRVWKVDKTNWADRNITIKLHGNVTNTYLLISNSSATFSSIDEELTLNADSTITISSNLLPDGAYFTFGKQLKGPGFVNPGVQLWVRADDGISSPSEWSDFSGNDNNAVQNTVANQPVSIGSSVNFNPGFDFDGSNDFMDFATNGTISGTNLFTIVSATKRGSIGTTDVILGQQSDATNSLTNYFVAANKYGIGPVNVGSITSTGTYSVANIPYINSTTRSVGNLFNLYTNGGADGSGTQAYTFLTNNLRIGTRGGGGADYFNGDVNEIVVYNRPLTAAELQQVHSYLGLKYGITLNNGTMDYLATDGLTKMWTVAKNTGYINNIAGIGRDDKTALYQRQSRSVNDTTITIAAGTTVAATNAANTTAIDELSFFAWADNNLATTFSIAMTGVPNATTRMARVWKVDRTDWSDQDITIKVAQGGERYLLVHATDPTFGAGTVEYPITTLTGTVTLNSSNLPDGAYFTLGTKIVGPGCVNAGIVSWFRADYGASAGNWIDFSGNQVNAAQATVANQPGLNATAFNYNPGVIFNGSTQGLIIPNASTLGKYPFGATARTVVAVGAANVATPAGYGMMFAYGANGTGTGTYIGQVPANTTAGFGGYNSVTYNIAGTVGSFPANTTRIIGGRYSGTTAYLDINGAMNNSLVTTWNTNSTQNAFIGQGVPTTTQFWNGRTGEIIVYNRELTAPELLRVNSYLGLKYGVTINSGTTDYVASDNTTRMWTAADNAGYITRITGIGRDDCTDLYQKQSISAEAGIVAVAIGDVVETSNVDNAATIDNNNSYFVFADNNAAATYTVALTGLDPLTTSMARTWKVDRTNWTDANITFKLTGGTENIYMLVSADATFDGSDASYQLDASGSVTIPSDQLPDASYFTFAKTLNGPGYVNVGVQLWLRADDNLSTVDTWNDFSGNENHATQATAANQSVAVANSVNYNPAFDFDGTDDYMDFATNGSISGTNPFTTGSVQVRGTTSTHDAVLSGQGNVANNVLVYHTNAGKYGIAPTGSTTIATTGTYATAGIPYMNTTTRSANLFSLYTNGGADGSGTLASNFLSTNLRLGNRSVSADVAFDGNMNEVFVYNRTLSATELRQVHSYLALKYGITMAGDYIATDGATPYWTAASNTGYLNNIAGIGRDDKTALYQKQSRSVNTASNGNMVAMGLGAIAATNKDNANTITDDMNFLVWGDNGATGTKLTEYPTALDPGACSKITRLQREWKVQVTGNPGSVQLQVYLAGIVPVSTGMSDLKLLVDDDGDFSSGVTTIIDPSLYDAVTQTVSFNDLTLANGQYFTLVTDLTNQAPGGVLPNLYTWYRADKGITLGTGVNGWADQSLSLKDVTQATAGAQPVYNSTTNLINFNPTLTFDGTNDVLSNTTISHSGTNGEDMFAVVLPNSLPAAVHDIIGLGTVANTGNSTEFRLSSDRLNYISANSTTIGSIANPSTSLGVQLANANKSNTGAASIFLNGNSVSTGTIAEMPVSNQLNLGARRLSGVNGLFFNGRMAEVVLYNRQLNAAERQQVTSYLAIKYGITLPHNYIDPGSNVLWDVTLNTGYNNNITGISRDDCNGLHQKQSKSVNAAEALVTAGNYNGIFTTNAGNPNSLDNNSALLFGDNNGNRAAWTATGAPANRERIARTWRVQKTGNISTITIQAPSNASAATVKLPLEKDGVVYLLVSTSGDFVNDVTEVPMTLNGTEWETTFDFTSGQYFTFATNNDCVSATSKLTTYGTTTTAATDKCYINGWLLFKDPVDPGRYIAAIYDPLALIDKTKITASVVVNSNFADIGKGNTAKATRLMRRMLQVDCATCYDAVANPTPNFTVRMFYSPTEKTDAESVETNNMIDLKTTNGITDPHVFKWFKAADKTAAQVVAGLTPAGISAGGQEWQDGALLTGLVDAVDYVDFDGVNSFSTFGGAWIVNVTNVLPVAWLDVQAIPVANRHIAVKWSTASETGNAGFEIQRSSDGVRFTTISSVGGNGTTSAVSYYSFDDLQVQGGTKYYYRIRQIDINGYATYSKIVSAQLKSAGITVKVMPNPVTTKLQLQVASGKAQALQVMLVDVSGRVIKNLQANVQVGETIVSTDVSAFSNGTYMVRIIAADGTMTVEKFIIMKDQ